MVLAQYDFRSFGLGISTVVLFHVRASGLSQTEITNFEIASLIEKQVICFDVFMHIPLLIHFFKP